MRLLTRRLPASSQLPDRLWRNSKRRRPTRKGARQKSCLARARLKHAARSTTTNSKDDFSRILLSSGFSPHLVHALPSDADGVSQGIEIVQFILGQTLRGWRRRGRRGNRDRRWWRRCEPISHARDKVVGLVVRIILKICPRDAELRPDGREVAVVEIESESITEVIPDAGDPLIAELPATAVENLTDPRQLEPIEDIGRSNAEPMRRNRVAGREVVEDIGHDRVAVPVATGRVYCKVACDQITGSVLAIA